MSKILSILHVEDEWHEYTDYVHLVKNLVESYWYEQTKEVKFAKVKISGQSTAKLTEENKKLPLSWQAFSIATGLDDGSFIEYTFVGPSTVPDEVLINLAKKRFFILDVLRPKEGQASLAVSVDETLNSLRGYLEDIEQAVLFTAHQGNGVDYSSPKMPRKISKDHKSELAELLSELVVGCLTGG
ncbi:hypothetical protein NBRC116590_16920 [Pelagimonas sp. KU-00592-HH]|uniref:hypothetical protein n=1 Tax=Pelagimonas sp. KU-00592-HH TaxID=3127651 RepID=UPI00310A8A9A